MKKNFTWLFAAILIFSLSPAFGQNTYWQDLQGKTAPSKYPMAVKPDKYELFTLQTTQLKELLSSAGQSYKDGVAIYLPGSNHTMEKFIAWETPMMAPELAKEFPEIRTYTATSTENPSVSVKLDFTDYGFRAAIYGDNGVYLIDPYSDHEDGYYIGFFENDLAINRKGFTCEVNEHSNLLHPEGKEMQIGREKRPLGQQAQYTQNGAVRHTFKLAMACTGEYAAVVTNGNPTPALVLSKVVSTINRVNGVYEREFSVNFNLISGEPDILFVDPNTDPYTCNLNMDCLLGENQIAVDQRIGSANYDIGHIFCTAGGGLAALYSVCNPRTKSQAASTSGGPDDFRVPIHEMGHQFSAGHTFNAESGGCNGNIDTTNSYEPGSGSTVMSYAGACAPNNVASSPGNYYNVTSLMQVHTFLANQGSVTGCGTTASGINSVTIPSNLAKVYNIPKSTPFVLKSPEVAPSQLNASISYNWEQHDLGNFGGTEADEGNATEGPVMQSYPPTVNNNVRYFPIDKILDGSYTRVGERLPKRARTLNFKLSTRSIINGWGSYAYMDSSVIIKVANSGPFRVTAPASAGTFNPGDTVVVNWNAANTNQLPVDCQSVNIFLSTDGGQTFPFLLAGSVPNVNGTAKVVIPDLGTTKGYIMVQGVSNIFYDVAKGKLKINGSTGIVQTYLKSQLKIYPNPATNMINLQYSGVVTEPLIVNMYDMSGRLVWSGKMKSNLSIPVSNFARGIYQIQVINGKTAQFANLPVSLK